MINFHDVNKLGAFTSQKAFLGKLIRLPLWLVPRSAVVPILQGPGRGLKWIVGSYNHGCWLGSYEFEKQVIIPQIVQPGDVVCDIGAHVGYFTIIFARLVGPTGAVYAFEPDSHNHSLIERHVALNGLKNVTAVKAGVGDRDGVAYFEVGANSATGKIAPASATQIELIELTEFLVRNKLRTPNLIKMDIEGAERVVIPALLGFIVKNRINVLVSTHADSITRDLVVLLEGNGYTVEPLQWANQPTVRSKINATLLWARL